MQQAVYLVKVEANANNNKFYRMIPDNSGQFLVQYGRIGNSSFQTSSYGMSQWHKKYNEKVKKGYVDQTHLVAEPTITIKKSKEYSDIMNKNIAMIVQRLQSMAKQAIKDNYTISSNNVTQIMVDTAQVKLGELIKCKDVDMFNTLLIELFSIIPRKMSRVSDYLATDVDRFGHILEREQDLLDVMAGQIKQQSIETPNEDSSNEELTTHNMTILEAMGLMFEEVDDSEISMIKNLMGSGSRQFVNAWKITNIKTQSRFDKFVSDENIRDTRLFWHGSSSCNWWSILNLGMMLRPNAVITGKMWGFGIYTSPDFDKSRGYTSVSGSRWSHGNDNTGFIALMDIAYGNPFNAYSFDSKYYEMDYKSLKNIGNYDSIHAHGGTGMLRKDEVIVYKENQITIKYLVEIR